MRRLVIFGLVIGALAVAPAAQAAVISLPSGQLNLFAYNAGGSSGPVPDFKALTASVGFYSASWTVMLDANGNVTGPFGAVSVDFRWTGAGFGVAGDTFLLPVINNNENPWPFSVSINGGAVQGPVSIPVPDGVNVFSFAGITGPITRIDVFLDGNLPMPSGTGNDRVAEFQLAPIPEPASMLLFGTGLVGLAGAVRRRLKK